MDFSCSHRALLGSKPGPEREAGLETAPGRDVFQNVSVEGI